MMMLQAQQQKSSSKILATKRKLAKAVQAANSQNAYISPGIYTSQQAQNNAVSCSGEL